MVKIGQQIFKLNNRFAGLYSWSEFGWLIVYPERAVIFHSLNSNTIVCRLDYQKRIEKCLLSLSEQELLRKNGIIITRESQDQDLIKRVRKKISQPKPLVTLFLIVTDECNLCCKYCYEDLKRYGLHQNMSLEIMKRSVDKFLAICDEDAKIFFYGGEPLLFENRIRKIIKYIRENLGNWQVDIQITTNATIYRSDLVDFLKKYKIGIGISLDGPEKVNNKIRLSKNSSLNVYQRAVRLLKDSQDAGLDYSLLCTITEDNSDQIVDICKFFLTCLNVRKINFNLKLKQPYQSHKDQKRFWHRTAENIANAYFVMLGSEVMEGRTLRYITGLTEGTYSISECDAGYGAQIVVNPAGLIGPCQGFLYDTQFFIKTDDWENISQHLLWKKFTNTTPINISQCRDCPFLGTCGGGCHYNRIKFDSPNPNFCQYTRSLLYSIISHIKN